VQQHISLISSALWVTVKDLLHQQPLLRWYDSFLQVAIAEHTASASSLSFSHEQQHCCLPKPV